MFAVKSCTKITLNGSLLGTVSITAWTPYSGGGYIGLWYANTSGAIVDDFGGGNVSASATATNTSTPTSTNTSTITRTPTVTTSPAGTMTPSRTLTPANTLTPSQTPTITASTTLTNIPTFTPAFTSTPTSTPPPSGPVTINYAYDPLYRLTEANYSNGNYYHYAYDAVGNRLSQTTELAVSSYQYDAANRLTSVDGVSYTWDANGNLLNDGVNTYVYDSANRLTALSNQRSASSYQYNGLGDRLTQSAAGGNTTNYTLDLNTGLTQVLNDGTNSYLYGVGRIAQVNTTTEYFLGDALGSVRQLTDASGEITLARTYEPYGDLAQVNGSAQTDYGFTGEFTDPSGMVYLRARYYSSGDGRFTSKDTWAGNINEPSSLNRWDYTNGNPINYIDPSGHCAGYKGIDPFINTAMSFTALYIFDADHWKATGNSWKESWNTCVESFQKAGATYQRGDYMRAYLYANGVSASMHQAAERIAQINHELDILGCKNASLGDKIVAGLDVGAWSIGIASFITPFAYEGWLATKGAISNKYLSGLSVGVPDEFLPPSIRLAELGKLNAEQTLSTQALAYETGMPVTITGRWSDTISEAAWRAKALARMEELISQGAPRQQALNQAAQEFGVFQHQVKISLGQNEVDAYIPKAMWNNLSYAQQRQITARLREIYGVDYVDWRQILIPEPGWPNPSNTIPPGSITFDPYGDIIHIPFGR